ncbi:hypothetical protein [Streptomyces sp. NPDC092952]|uniref:deazapurine DNA modification protein DpdA family protein n=1 Tax=Streptomyces sp. NPDC092952 TaxID=3366018 RepID=UPI00382FE547
MVCRRQASGQIESIVRTLANQGLALHGFGVKTAGLTSYADGLVEADSMAWPMGPDAALRCPATATKAAATAGNGRIAGTTA